MGSAGTSSRARPRWPALAGRAFNRQSRSSRSSSRGCNNARGVRPRAGSRGAARRPLGRRTAARVRRGAGGARLGGGGAALLRRGAGGGACERRGALGVRVRHAVQVQAQARARSARVPRSVACVHAHGVPTLTAARLAQRLCGVHLVRGLCARQRRRRRLGRHGVDRRGHLGRRRVRQHAEPGARRRRQRPACAARARVAMPRVRASRCAA